MAFWFCGILLLSLVIAPASSSLVFFGERKENVEFRMSCAIGILFDDMASILKQPAPALLYKIPFPTILDDQFLY